MIIMYMSYFRASNSSTALVKNIRHLINYYLKFYLKNWFIAFAVKSVNYPFFEESFIFIYNPSYEWIKLTI